MRFARWMATRWGRGPRIALGLALIAFGIYLQNPWGILIAIVGVLPIASGFDNFCIAAPIFGGRIDGRPLAK
jgi:DUF2892 family protein